MTNETSIWADFGVDQATVVAPQEDQDYLNDMIRTAGDVRDGDDLIEVVEEQEETTPLTSEQLNAAMNGEEQGDLYGDQGDDSLRIDTETGEENDPSSDDDEVPTDDGDETPVEIGEVGEELQSAVEALNEQTQGFNSMVEQALSNGDVDEATVEAIKQEYLESEGLSEDTYKLLEEKGYSRGFVDSFIKGQELLSQSYATHMLNFVGGVDNYNRTVEYLETNNPAMAEMLNNAVETMDLTAVKAIFDSVASQRVARYGKAPARNVAQRASTPKATPKASTGLQPFGSVDAMVKAMSDPRYSNDEAYRAEVEKRVLLMG